MSDWTSSAVGAFYPDIKERPLNNFLFCEPASQPRPVLSCCCHELQQHSIIERPARSRDVDTAAIEAAERHLLIHHLALRKALGKGPVYQRQSKLVMVPASDGKAFCGRFREDHPIQMHPVLVSWTAAVCPGGARLKVVFAYGSCASDGARHNMPISQQLLESLAIL